uniref:Uncharacterized protein n=1 Tax=Arundo donax TaxID=35708 RepID=A0A0A9A9T7_ARUDO
MSTAGPHLSDRAPLCSDAATCSHPDHSSEAKSGECARGTSHVPGHS